jgi:hypothetical protein
MHLVHELCVGQLSCAHRLQLTQILHQEQQHQHKPHDSQKGACVFTQHMPPIIALVRSMLDIVDDYRRSQAITQQPRERLRA